MRSRRDLLARLRAVRLPVAGGLLTSLGLPPTDLVPAVLVGVAVLAFSVRDAPDARTAVVRGMAWGTAGGLAGLWFLVATVDRFSGLGPVAGVLAAVGLALAQSLAWGAGAGLTWNVARRTAVPFPVAFGAGVYVTSLLPGLFAWTPAGLLAVRPELVQGAELVGERGVTFLVAVLAALAVHGLRPGDAVPTRPRRTAIVPVLSALLLLGALDRWGAGRMEDADRAPDGGTLAVALLDPDAPPRRTLDPGERLRRISRLRALSAQADRAAVDLVVWPEGAYPFSVDRRARALTDGATSPLWPGARAPRLMGLRVVDVDRRAGRARVLRRFNSATLVDHRDGTLQPAYDKLKLLWFGETVPLAGVVPGLRELVGRRNDITPGTRARPLLLDRPAGLGPGPPVRIGVLICYEEVSPGVGRRVVRETRPQLLVNLTNDAWFEGTRLSSIQARFATLRAVEQRRPLVRAVNGGGSSWVDSAGRVRRERRATEPGLLLAEPRLAAADAGLTVYGRTGDMPLTAGLAVLLLAAAGAARRRPRE